MDLFKKVIFCMVLLTGSFYCYAQEISIRGGFNLSHIREEWGGRNVTADNSGNPGFQFGPILEFPIMERSSNMLSLETGILYSSKGFRQQKSLDVKDYLYKDDLFYLELPVLLKMTVEGKKLTFFALAGPYLGEALSGKDKQTGTINDVYYEYKQPIRWGEQYRRFDYGLKLGLGLRYAKYQIGASYEFGVNDITVMKPSNITNNRVFELYVAYALINLKRNKK